MTNAKYFFKASSSCLHLVAAILIKLVPGHSELFCDDITQVHQVVEALFQGF